MQISLQESMKWKKLVLSLEMKCFDKMLPKKMKNFAKKLQLKISLPTIQKKKEIKSKMIKNGANKKFRDDIKITSL